MFILSELLMQICVKKIKNKIASLISFNDFFFFRGQKHCKFFLLISVSELDHSGLTLILSEFVWCLVVFCFCYRIFSNMFILSCSKYQTKKISITFAFIFTGSEQVHVIFRKPLNSAGPETDQ